MIVFIVVKVILPFMQDFLGLFSEFAAASPRQRVSKLAGLVETGKIVCGSGCGLEAAADDWGWIGCGFAIGAGGGAEAPVVFEDEAQGGGVSIGGDGAARGDDDADVGVDGAMLLGDDIAGAGEFAREGGGPAGDGDARVSPFVRRGIAGDDAEVAGDAGAGPTGGLDPVGDGLVAFVAAGAVPAVPAGSEVAGVSAVVEGDWGDG